ncbi:RICIN domain-containing protein [Streptomyces gamaensis]|uniref:RICIN domain-containing protein n=1 Tax=Streptomyces gamaensis TaxID=1763542 RepID=A0ABW0Z3Q8_9ACTN
MPYTDSPRLRSRSSVSSRRTAFIATAVPGVLSLAVTLTAIAPANAAPSDSRGRAGESVEQLALTDAAGKPTDKVAPQEKTARDEQTLSTGPLTGKDFSTIGLSWKKDSPVAPGTSATARFHKDGGWSDWRRIPLELDEAVNSEAERAGSPAYFSGDADGVELKVTTPHGALPQDLRLAMVDPGETAPVKKRQRRAAEAEPAQQPTVRSRADWGADESLADPGYKTQQTIKAAMVHHTVTNNDYAPEDVPKIINGIYVHHITQLKYGDFPYNFVVDRFGGIWEGRKGSVKMRPGTDIPGIVGGHAQGFNTDTFGVAALGNFEPNNSEAGKNTGPDPRPTEEMRDSLAGLLAWKLGQYGLDPKGKVDLTSRGGGGTNPHAQGKVLNVDVITSHRDVNATACPGRKMYDLLPDLREKVAQRISSDTQQPGFNGVIKNANSGLCLEVENSSRNDGAQVQQWECRGQRGTEWSIQDAGDGYVHIINKNSGKALEIENSSKNDGARAQQWANRGQNGAKWRINDTSRGLLLQNKASGKILEIDNSSKANGAKAQQWTGKGQPGGYWRK